MLVLEKDGLAEVRKNAVGECPALRLILHLKIATEKNRVFCRIQCYLQAQRRFWGSFFGIDPKKFRVNRSGPPQNDPRTPGLGVGECPALCLILDLSKASDFGIPKWASENAPPYV